MSGTRVLCDTRVRDRVMRSSRGHGNTRGCRPRARLRSSSDVSNRRGTGAERGTGYQHRGYVGFLSAASTCVWVEREQPAHVRDPVETVPDLVAQCADRFVALRGKNLFMDNWAEVTRSTTRLWFIYE